MRLRPCLCIVLFLLSLTCRAGTMAPIVVAVEQHSPRTMTAAIVTETLQRLQYSLYGHPFITLELTAADILREKSSWDFLIASPDILATLEHRKKATPFAFLTIYKNPLPARAAGTLALVSENSALKTLESLEGAEFITVDPYDTYSALLLRAQLNQRDSATHRAVMQRQTLPSEQQALERLAHSSHTVLLLKTCQWESLRARLVPGAEHVRPLEALQDDFLPCFSSTSLYPDWGMAVADTTDAELTDSVAGNLTALDSLPFEGRWTAGDQLQDVHALLSSLKVPSYVKRTFSLSELMSTYRTALLSLFLCLAGLAVHSLRSSLLVRRKTRELLQSAHENALLQARTRTVEQHIEALERLNIVGQMSTMITHEVKQPLAIIHAYVRGLLRRMDHGALDEQTMRSVLEIIDAQNGKAGDIVEHVRSYAKEQVHPRHPIDVSAKIGDAVRAFELTAAAQNITLSQHLSGRPYVLAADLEFELIIRNLLKNAAESVDAQPDGQVDVATRVADGRVIIEIRDNGPVISEDNFSRLTTPLTSTKPHGLGLGLAIVNRIIEAYGGKLEFEKRPEGGLTVRVILPCTTKETQQHADL